VDPERPRNDDTVSSPGPGPLRTVLPRGAVLDGRYRIIEPVGEGGNGVVYAARDLEVPQTVAVKVLHPEQVDPRAEERLRREVLASRVSHPNLVTVFDLGWSGRTAYLVMELVEGETLKERLVREGRLGVEEATAIARDVAAALAFLHGRGIVHRDVKPGNILIEKATGRAKLGDTGLARSVDQGMTVTGTKVVSGTPAYMAPEQASGERAGTAMDVYALGLVLHECLTGEVPLTGDTAISTLIRRQKKRPGPVVRRRREVPAWLSRLVGRMLEPDPRDRPTADQVLGALEGHRFAFAPLRRHFVAAVLVLAALAGAGATFATIRARRIAEVGVFGDELRGLGRNGVVAWSLPLGPGHHRLIETDIDGDGTDEVVVATFGAAQTATDGKVLEWNPGDVLAVGRDGRVRTRLDLASLPENLWPFRYPRRFAIDLWGRDLDGDGRDEVIAAVRHRSFYPQVLFIYWPSADRWREVLVHSGWIDWVAPLPPEGKTVRLAFSGVNNLLGRVRVLGFLALQPPGPSKAAAGIGDDMEPPMVKGLPQRVFGKDVRLAAYVPIGFRKGASPSGTIREDMIEIGWDGWKVRLDRYGNPVPGPNAGKDLREARMAFFWALWDVVGKKPPRSVEEAEARLAVIERDAGTLLEERPYRAIFAQQEAKVLARLGEPMRARQALDPVVMWPGCERFRLRSIELLALGGRLRRALDEAWTLLGQRRRIEVTFDVEVLIHRLALELRDRDALERLLSVSSAGGAEFLSAGTARNEYYRAVLLRRSRLWWDELQPGDAELLESGYDPASPAVTVLCRWRLGKTRPEDEGLAGRLIREGGDLEGEGRIALAAARIGSGRPLEALPILDPVIQRLRDDARVRFDALLNLELARALRARALLDAGDPDTAARTARDVLETAPRDVLPGIVADEVLREISG